MVKKFIAMEGPAFEPEDQERVRVKVYLDQDVYEQLEEMAEERDMSPAKLLGLILLDWASD